MIGLNDCVDNILVVYASADLPTRASGRSWYAREQAALANLARGTDLTLPQLAGAASAISPGMRWALVLGCVRALVARQPVAIPTYNREFVRRARACLRPSAAPENILSGPKTTNFYRLLRDGGNSVDVCVDGHAWNVARGARDNIRASEVYKPPAAARVNMARYLRAAEAYRIAGRLTGERPCDIQAITWLAWRARDNQPSLFAVPF